MATGCKKGNTTAVLKTSMGDIEIELYQNEAPETVKYFVELAKAGKYENVPFHRVINDFMVQTGDFENKNGTGGHSYKGEGTYLEDEFGKGLEHVYGAVSMANAGPNTGGSQFFIVDAPKGTDWLDGHHSIFGIVKDMDVVEKISEVDVNAMDNPLEEVLILSVEIND